MRLTSLAACFLGLGGPKGRLKREERQKALHRHAHTQLARPISLLTAATILVTPNASAKHPPYPISEANQLESAALLHTQPLTEPTHIKS